MIPDPLELPIGDSVSWTNSQAVAKDDGSGNYDSTQWVDMNGDGTPDSNADAYHSTAGAPVSYQANGAGDFADMQMHVVMKVASGSFPDGTYTIKGIDEGDSGMTFQGYATASGTTLTADVTSDHALPSTILDGNMQIVWTVDRSVPGLDHTELAPNSYNHLYVTGASAPAAFETVLDVGCRSAMDDDPSNSSNVLWDVWDTFSSKRVLAADRTTPLTYAIGLAADTLDERFLVAADVGQCTDWTQFLSDVLATQGVQATIVTIRPPLTLLAGTEPEAIIVNEAACQNGTGVFPGDLGGRTFFAVHSVVESADAPGYVFDPSYGRIAQSTTAGGLALTAEQAYERDYIYAYDDTAGTRHVVGTTDYASLHGSPIGYWSHH